MDRTCAVCGKLFRDPASLKRHSNNKSPCGQKVEPIIGARHPCPHCNRDFTTDTAKYRHIRNFCKVRRTPAVIDQLTAKVQELEQRLNDSQKQGNIVNNYGNVANTQFKELE